MIRSHIDNIYKLVHFPSLSKKINEIGEFPISRLIEDLPKNKITEKITQQVEQFPKSNKSKSLFYSTWRDAISYTLEVNNEINRKDNDFEKYYIVNYELNKVLSPLLSKLSEKLKSNRSQFFNSSKKNQKIQFEDNLNFGELLKNVLMYTYLHIQDTFNDYVLQDCFSQSELEKKYFDSHIKVTKSVGVRNYYQVQNPLSVPGTIDLFQIRYDDFTPKLKSRPNYNEIVCDKHQLGFVESQMYKSGLIDLEYSFIPCKAESHHTLMAVIYHEIIDKGLFNKYFSRQKKNFKPSDYRKYLDDRYSVDTSQQFRKMVASHREIGLKKLPWLDEIKCSF